MEVEYTQDHVEGTLTVPIFIKSHNQAIWVVQNTEQKKSEPVSIGRLDFGTTKSSAKGQVDSETARTTLSNLLNGAEIVLISVDDLQNEEFDLKSHLNL